MDPATASLVGGAALGVAFQEVYTTIKRTVVRSSTIKKRLNSLAHKLTELSIRFDGFEKHYEDFGSRPETLNMRELLEKANALVRDCAPLRWWHLWLVRKYSKRLKTLNDSFEDFLKVDLQVAQYGRILAIEEQIVGKNKKLDRMYVSKPLSSSGYGGSYRNQNVRLRSQKPSGLRAEFHYERTGKYEVKFCLSFCFEGRGSDRYHDD
ncbi:RPW8-like protein 3 [Linum grandiflorum]